MPANLQMEREGLAAFPWYQQATAHHSADYTNPGAEKILRHPKFQLRAALVALLLIPEVPREDLDRHSKSLNSPNQVLLLRGHGIKIKTTRIPPWGSAVYSLMEESRRDAEALLRQLEAARHG